MIAWLLAMLLSQQVPARDQAGLPRAGTSSITGVVVSNDAEARPLRRVVVALTTNAVPLQRAALTDDAGRFVFMGIGAGTYTLQASRTGYVTTYYGSKRPGRGPGIPVAVAEGQNVSGLTLKMLKGAVISGVVRMPAGKPVAELTVFASAITTVNGQRQIDNSAALVRSATSNDRGEYRIFGLPPGDYVVQVSTPSSSTDLRRMTASDVASAEALLRADAGSPAGPPSAPGPSVGFAPIFFPSTPDINAAEVIPLGAGQERSGIDLTMAFVPNSRLNGTVISPDGRPPQNVRLSLNASRPGQSDMYVFNNYIGVQTGKDGFFYASGITPGHYVLTARAAPGGDAPPPPGSPGAAPIPSGLVSSAALTLWGSVEFDVNGQDVSNLVLNLQQGMTVSGRFIYDSTVPPPPDPTRTRINLVPVTAPGAPAQVTTFLASSATSIEKDGTFAIKGATPGQYRVSVTTVGMPPQPVPGMRMWVVKSVMVDGRDIADLPIQIRPGDDVADVVVTMTDQPTEVSGTVLDGLNRPTSGFPIVVFAADRAYWAAGDARVRKIQPASDGKYSITGLPAGDYYVCAVTDAEPNDLKDPAFLDSLAPASFKITLKPGEKRTLDLKLGGG